MKVFLLGMLLLTSCAHKEGPVLQNHQLVKKMTPEEKYKILRSYRFLQSRTGNPGRIPMTEGYLPGVPRLGIPSIEFMGADRSRRAVAREEKTLKLGFVNLIRDSEKTQVFGNFNAAEAVDSILSPDHSAEIKDIANRGELKDLDLFLLQKGTTGNFQNFVCAQYHETVEFHCVTAKMETILNQMGISGQFDELLAREKLSEVQLDRLVGEVLNTMDELKLL